MEKREKGVAERSDLGLRTTLAVNLLVNSYHHPMRATPGSIYLVHHGCLTCQAKGQTVATNHPQVGVENLCYTSTDRWRVCGHRQWAALSRMYYAANT